MTVGVHAGMTVGVHAGMTVEVHAWVTEEVHAWTAGLFLSPRPPSRDLPIALTPLKLPFMEIPAQEHAGMTVGVHAGMTVEVHAWVTEEVHAWTAGLFLSSRPTSRDLLIALTQLNNLL